MGWKEVPLVNLSLADIVADEFLPDAACFHEVLRLVDHSHDGSSGFLICQVARLYQDDHAGQHALRFLRFVNTANLVRPEDKRAGV